MRRHEPFFLVAAAYLTGAFTQTHILPESLILILTFVNMAIIGWRIALWERK